MKWTVKAATEITKISAGNSKMPGSTFSTDAFACHVGSKLAKVEGSVCSGCYARKIQKLRPSVNKGWQANYIKAVTMINSNPDKWADAVAFQIMRIANKTGEMFHRWFDSGDLDSVEMLRAIVKACEKTPQIKHWLPTREAKIVKQYRKTYGPEPKNLVIRVSATMIGDKPVAGHALTSTVHHKGADIYGKECLAYRTDTTRGLVSEQEYKAARKSKDKSYDFGHCGDCRACWSVDVANVSYTKH